MLLPFDEYLPWRDYVKWPSWIVSADMIDKRPGKELTIFSMRNLRFGVQICWESLFPDLFRNIAAQRVDFMVNITNEEFTDTPSAHYQMLAMTVFRAIENGVAIVRTTPTGVSAIIDPNGKISARLQDANLNDTNIEGHLVGQVPISSERTFYNRYGDWFVYILTAVFIGFLVLAAVTKPIARKMKANENK
jgi:apolipoprotein N-acyltransferase